VRGAGRGGGAQRLRLHPALTSQPAFLVVELAAEVRETVGTELGEAGLDWPSQLVLAVTDAVSGDLPQEALSARTGIDRSSLSFLVRDLEDDGFLERRRHPEARDEDRHWLFGWARGFAQTGVTGLCFCGQLRSRES
jgi:hypothetical protein